MIAVEQEEEDDGERETVAVGIRQRTRHHFRSHVAGLACNAEVGAVENDIVVVADKDIARIGVDKEVTIVKVLVAQSLAMQRLEGIADMDGCAEEGLHRGEALFGEQKAGKLHIVLRAERHDIAEAAVLHLGEVLGPEKGGRRRTDTDIGLVVMVEIGIGGISRMRVPLERHLLAIEIHGVDRTLSSLSEKLEDTGGLAVGEGDNAFRGEHSLVF